MGYILSIFWAYLGHILGNTWAYLGRAVWSSWQEILGSDGAGDIGNLQAVGDEGYQNEREDREGGQEETDGAISQEEEKDEPGPIEIDMDVDRWDLSILIFAFLGNNQLFPLHEDSVNKL